MALFSPYPLPSFLLLPSRMALGKLHNRRGAGPGPLGPRDGGEGQRADRALMAGVLSGPGYNSKWTPDFMRLPGQQGRTKTFETQRHSTQSAIGDGLACWLGCAGPSCVGMDNTTVLRRTLNISISSSSRAPPLHLRFLFAVCWGGDTPGFRFEGGAYLSLSSRVCRSRNSKKGTMDANMRDYINYAGQTDTTYVRACRRRVRVSGY